MADQPGGIKVIESSVDNIYAQERERIERFSFDQDVVRVFPDMIKRSVPGYSSIIDMIGILAARYARPGTTLYDLGCSLGAASFAMARMVPHADCRIVAVDNSAAMIARARTMMAEYQDAGSCPVDFVLSDIREFSLERPASMAVLNFTLQFISPLDRDRLLGRVAQALMPGDILVLSEKIRFEDEQEENLQQSLYYAFKKNNGYSEMEISQKRTALENVLIPETLAQHEARLRRVGFSDVYVWFRCFNFCSMIAVR